MFRRIALVAMIGLFAFGRRTPKRAVLVAGMAADMAAVAAFIQAVAAVPASEVEDLEPVGSDRHPRAEAFTVAPR